MRTALARCDPLVLHNCPSTSLDFSLPEDQGYVDVDPLLRITDYTGLNRLIIFTRQPDMTRFWWDDTPDLLHKVNVTVHAWSPEGQLDKDVCVYTISVKGG